jgi:hypothetical protein
MSYILVELIDDLHNFLKLLVRSVSVKRSKDKEIEINVNTKKTKKNKKSNATTLK